MTEQEAIDKLNALPGKNAEYDHIDADQIIADFLRGVGYAALADAYEQTRDRVGFWYA